MFGPPPPNPLLTKLGNQISNLEQTVAKLTKAFPNFANLEAKVSKIPISSPPDYFTQLISLENSLTQVKQDIAKLSNKPAPPPPLPRTLRETSTSTADLPAPKTYASASTTTDPPAKRPKATKSAAPKPATKASPSPSTETISPEPQTSSPASSNATITPPTPKPRNVPIPKQAGNTPPPPLTPPLPSLLKKETTSSSGKTETSWAKIAAQFPEESKRMNNFRPPRSHSSPTDLAIDSSLDMPLHPWTFNFINGSKPANQLSPQIVVSRINSLKLKRKLIAKEAHWTQKGNLVVSFDKPTSISPHHVRDMGLQLSAALFPDIPPSSIHLGQAVNWSHLLYRNVPSTNLTTNTPFLPDDLLKAVKESSPHLFNATFRLSPSWTRKELDPSRECHNLSFAIEDPSGDILNKLTSSKAFMFGSAIKPAVWKNKTRVT